MPAIITSITGDPQPSVQSKLEEYSAAQMETIERLASECSTVEKLNAATLAQAKLNWKTIALRSANFLAGVGMGIMAGFTIMGTMITPVGWALAGFLALTLLYAAYKHAGGWDGNGCKELWENIKMLWLGFGMAFSIANVVAISTSISSGAVTLLQALKRPDFWCPIVGTAMAGALVVETIRDWRKQRAKI